MSRYDHLGNAVGKQSDLASALAGALRDLTEAWDAEREARGPDPAYDWDYYGAQYFKRIGECERQVADKLDEYLADYIERREGGRSWLTRDLVAQADTLRDERDRARSAGRELASERDEALAQTSVLRDAVERIAYGTWGDTLADAEVATLMEEIATDALARLDGAR